MKLLTSWIVAATVLLAGAAQGQEIGGEYDVEGANLDGSAYQGTATITVTSDTTCRIHWSTGATSSDGICMVNQNAFAAAYAFDDGTIGLVVYEVLADGTLDGIWTIADSEGAGTEILRPR